MEWPHLMAKALLKASQYYSTTCRLGQCRANEQPRFLLMQGILACPARFERATYALEAVKNELKQ